LDLRVLLKSNARIEKKISSEDEKTNPGDQKNIRGPDREIKNQKINGQKDLVFQS
jgi:hypothetical protein